MGYFLKKFGIKPIMEADADDQNIENTNDQPADYTEEQPATDDTSTDQNNDQEQETETDQQDDNAIPQEEETPDYSEQDAEMGDPSSDDSDNQDADNNSDSSAEDNQDDQPVDDIKKQEEEIYSNLSSDQLDIKHKELKAQFLAMYDITSSIIERIGDANVNEDNIGVIEYISDNLSRMRTMLTDYIESVYSGKSYTENSINYNRFLSVLNGINKLLEQLEKKEDK